jgi:hypothetical protein
VGLVPKIAKIIKIPKVMFNTAENPISTATNMIPNGRRTVSACDVGTPFVVIERLFGENERITSGGG